MFIIQTKTPPNEMFYGDRRVPRTLVNNHRTTELRWATSIKQHISLTLRTVCEKYITVKKGFYIYAANKIKCKGANLKIMGSFVTECHMHLYSGFQQSIKDTAHRQTHRHLDIQSNLSTVG